MIIEALIVIFVFFLGYITAIVMTASKMATIESEAQAAKKEASDCRERMITIIYEFRSKLLYKSRIISKEHIEFSDSVHRVDWTDVEQAYKEMEESLR